MNSKKLICLVVFAMAFLSLLFVRDIYGYFTEVTDPVVNQLSIEKNTSYTVVHEVMDTSGNYEELIDYREEHTNIPLGTTVTPDLLDTSVLPQEGFDFPQQQTVTLNSFTDTVITYQYPRKQFTLTINDSNYVTTDTPSGTYYYGQEIHLTADAEDSLGLPFMKWSNNEINPDYTFELTEDTTIGPIYAESITITYVPNNGENPFNENKVENEPITTFPNVEYNDCVGTTGSYHDRQCSYAYELEGWYKEPEFTNKVNELFVPTEDTTLYAKWNKIYYAYLEDEFTCTGANYIDTGITMFNRLNTSKDFIVTFRVLTNNGYTSQSGVQFGTIFTDMNEKKDPWPGVHFYSANSTSYTMNINTAGNRVKDSNTGFVTGQKVTIKKKNGIVYYNYNDGTDIQINDFSNFTTYFDNTASFCAGRDANLNWYRYFKGNISEMSVELINPDSYTIHFDPNGGTGLMLDQILAINGPPVALSDNLFTRTGHAFIGWNTEPDGSGTHYDDEEAVSNLCTTEGDVVTLYAEWKPADFIRNGDVVFDGTSATFIDTGINIFSPENFNKDFEIRFTFKSVDSDILSYTPVQPTILNVKDESNEYLPGFVIRFNPSNNNIGNIAVSPKWAANTNVGSQVYNVSPTNAPIDFVIKRVGNKITLSASYNDTTDTKTLINNQDWSSWPADHQFFTTNVAFGGYFDSSGNPGRFFKGTLSDISIFLYD